MQVPAIHGGIRRATTHDMNRITTLLVGLGLVCLAGCESGKEVAGVKSATATRDAQGRVSIHVELECTVVYGIGRASGCDADESEVCIHARWYAATDVGFEKSIAEARACAHQSWIRTAAMDVTTDTAIPKDPPTKIKVETEPQLDARDAKLTPIVIDRQ